MHSEKSTERIAREVVAGFDRHFDNFRKLSAFAKVCFERSDWTALSNIHRERIGSFDQNVQNTVAVILAEVPNANDEALWPAVKRATVLKLLDHRQPELAETFYNSVVCRVLERTYYTNKYLFWRQAVATDFLDGVLPTYRVYYPKDLGLRTTLQTIIDDFALACPWAHLGRDLRVVARRILELLPPPNELRPSLQVHVLSSLFIRGHAAYIIGRIRNGSDQFAFAVPILKDDAGNMYLDAFLSGTDEMTPLFSLSRSYFFADMEVPAAFVGFLQTAFPTRSTAELYTCLGLQKQGKTLFYRELDFHLNHSTDRFVIAQGKRGMVMCVFTLPSFPWVFKLIRDHFDPPKDLDRRQVRAQYTRVKMHDRVGRMADVWEYSDVALPLARVDPALLIELRDKVGSLLSFDDDKLIIKHLYIERRLVPLDVYLERANEEQTRQVMLDFGRAIRELATANLFAGDLLLKNFGVNRLGRVVFYDYDDIIAVDACVFRRLPTPRDESEEVSNDWVSVGPRDIFPEELPKFMFSDSDIRSLFLEMHAELVDPSWWIRLQETIAAGRSVETQPYSDAVRFHPRGL